MKKIFTNQFLCAVLFVSISAQAQDSLFISEVTDPGDDYTGRFIELYNAGSEVIDFNTTICYLSRQSNGGTSWGDLQLTGTVAAGSTFVIGGSGFEALYGKAPDQVSGILIGNGDDAYGLFLGGDHETGVLHDIFGAIDVDGTGELWEYEDSRALRLDAVLVPNASWDATEWEITPADVADCNPGTHLGSVVEPPGNFVLTLINDTVTLGQAVELPVAVSELTAADNIISYQFDISYDPLVLTYTGFSLTGTMADGGNAVVNDGVTGRLSVGYMHTSPLVGTGDILLLQFNSLALDTTELLISNAYLNSTPVPDLQTGTVIITEVAPPTAAITYSDTINRFADTLLITATFSEAMHAGNPVLLHMDGVVSLMDLEMNRLSENVYNYTYTIPKASGEVNLSLSNGTDLWGNEVVAIPTAGASFVIITFRPGDVDDDGVVLAYDAALTLQHSVGINPLPETDPLPWENWRDSTANVDGSGGITAYDAGMILQYSAGIISSFSSTALKSAPAAGVSIEVGDNYLLFRSRGELLGLNINTTNQQGLLGTPEVLKKEFMSAINMDGTTYRIGLCTASAASDGDAVMRIPYNGSGSVTFHIIENAEERVVTVDLLTGMFVSELSQIEIYPNPVIDMLLISGLSGPTFVRIYNIHGQLLLTAHTEGNRGEIDLSNLPGGIYMIMFEMGKETVIRKFLKR